MGSQDSDNFACNYQETVNYDESPVHQMKVSSFWIGRQKSLIFMESRYEFKSD